MRCKNPSQHVAKGEGEKKKLFVVAVSDGHCQYVVLRRTAVSDLYDMGTAKKGESERRTLRIFASGFKLND